jgi:hypothetical protein
MIFKNAGGEVGRMATLHEGAAYCLIFAFADSSPHHKLATCFVQTNALAINSAQFPFTQTSPKTPLALCWYALVRRG